MSDVQHATQLWSDGLAPHTAVHQLVVADEHLA